VSSNLSDVSSPNSRIGVNLFITFLKRTLPFNGVRSVTKPSKLSNPISCSHPCLSHPRTTALSTFIFPPLTML
ncbi:hypothetical protein KI387_004126, partial [Taxus chinensis]